MQNRQRNYQVSDFQVGYYLLLCSNPLLLIVKLTLQRQRHLAVSLLICQWLITVHQNTDIIRLEDDIYPLFLILMLPLFYLYIINWRWKMLAQNCSLSLVESRRKKMRNKQRKIPSIQFSSVTWYSKKMFGQGSQYGSVPSVRPHRFGGHFCRLSHLKVQKI